MKHDSLLHKLTILVLTLFLGLTSAACQVTLLSNGDAPVTVSSVREVAALALSAPASPPVRLIIPSINVDAAIESVGQSASGSMASPTYVEDVAWYNQGPIPGEIGKAVFAGHLDAIGGVPAVFYRIGSLQPGDAIIVIHEDGSESNFEVVQSAVYPYQETPFDKVFGFTLQSELNLITCTGSWNRNTQNYTDRLVVSAHEVNSPAQQE